MSQTLVDQFLADSDKLHLLVSGLTREQLLARPIAGTWSLQTLVIHVMDSDLIATHRMKRVMAEDMPLLIAYSEDGFAERLHYEKLDAMVAADLFRMNRVQAAQNLRHATEADWNRRGVHNQRGLVTLRDLVQSYNQHLEHHMVFAREKLKALGLPVKI